MSFDLPRLLLAHDRRWRFALLALWCVLIFAMSAQPDLQVASSDMLDFVLRKAAHVTVFGVLALLALSTVRQPRRSGKHSAAIAWSFTLVYAISDEWHQTFVRARHGSPVDVAIDMAGATTALAAYLWWAHRRIGLDRERAA